MTGPTRRIPGYPWDQPTTITGRKASWMQQVAEALAPYQVCGPVDRRVLEQVLDTGRITYALLDILQGYPLPASRNSYSVESLDCLLAMGLVERRLEVGPGRRPIMTFRLAPQEKWDAFLAADRLGDTVIPFDVLIR